MKKSRVIEHPQTPGEVVQNLHEAEEEEKDKQYHYPRSIRKDLRPERIHGKYNHKASAYLQELFLKSKTFSHKLEPYAQILPSNYEPESLLEKQMAKRINLHRYRFNYPLRIQLEPKYRMVLNLLTGKMEKQLVKKNFRTSNAFIFPGTPKQKAELQTRFMEYCAILNLPKDFRHKYPFIYAVLRDQFITKTIVYRNMKKLRVMNRLLHKLLLLQGQAFQRLYQLMGKIPAVQSYFADPKHKEDLKELKEIEKLLDPLGFDPNDPELKDKLDALADLNEFSKCETQAKKEEQALKKKTKKKAAIITQFTQQHRRT